MLIRRRTISLLGPESQRRARSPRIASSSSTDPKSISRSNWNSWRALLRILGIALSLISIGCVAWAYATGPKSTIDHHVSDGQDVPWVLIPLTLSTIYNFLSLLSTAPFSPLIALQPIPTLLCDLFSLLTLSAINLISNFGAVQTLQWTAAQYYDDATSGHDEYYILNPHDGEPGQPRYLKVPPANATVCSGWGGDCEAQGKFERATFRRARVEIGGVACAWGAVVPHLVVFVYACVAFHHFRKAKKRVRVQRMGFNIARTVVEERNIPVDYRFTSRRYA
ncbi:hypothetical protein G7Y79_00046g082370 [Physcia stellaris]|nr:hypothetical protein G7Y79_00046g082370 [Physcia stellaris]